MSELSPGIEAALLNQTEDALREMTQAALNCGASKVQMALMLRRVADELMPPIMVPEGHTVQ